MTDHDVPIEADTDPAGPATRWWFPAMFGVAFVAAAIAVVAYFQRDDGADPSQQDAGETAVTVPDLSSLGTDSPQVEDPAPDFTVPVIGGGTFSLADHLATDGRPVVLNLWASWCGPCREEMPAIDEAATRHPDVLFLGVAVKDSRDDAEGFAAEVGVDYPLAVDDAGAVDDGYSPLGLPATFFIDGNGGITSSYFGTLTVDLIAQQLEQAFGGS